MIRPHRQHPLWLAFMVHRISGIALALFLPLHFYVLSRVLTQPDAVDRFLQFADLLPVKVVESVLVFLLAVHVAGGLRLLAMEWLPWSGQQKSLAAASVGVAIFTSLAFLLQAL